MRHQLDPWVSSKVAEGLIHELMRAALLVQLLRVPRVTTDWCGSCKHTGLE